MLELLDLLRKFDALREGDRYQEASLPEQEPDYGHGDTLSRLSRKMQQALSDAKIERLYAHQEEAIGHALDGRNVVLQAPTASGKTLAFQIPMLETLAREKGTHALLIYPTKALAFDQREQLQKLTERIPRSKIESWWYDGDTDKEKRGVLRQKPPQILITTPEMVNSTFLGHSDLWRSFLDGLRWIVVDEMHEYRGYFGSNMALLLRRFGFHLAKAGIEPQLFLCSATCANPREHAENLTGREFVAVNAANSMRPHRDFTFVAPDIPNFRYWDILQLRTVKAGLACLHAGKSVLVFCPTRKFAESCYSTAEREIDRLAKEEGIQLDLGSMKVLRSGLSTDERYEVQAGLKSGDVRLVFTTNALELGLDIGGLDGVILAGFPDSMLSAWQRIGRAGRNWRSAAFVLYFARNNPLDQFYAENLRTFLDKPLDDLVASVSNDELIKRHIPALLFETEDLSGGEKILGDALFAAAQREQRSGATPVRNSRYRPHQAINLRGAGSGRFTVKDGESEIGTLSAQQQFREAYQRAIYLHGGRRYRVKQIELNSDGGDVILERCEQNLLTKPSLFTSLSGEDIFDGYRWNSGGHIVSTYYGKVLMTESMTKIEEIDDRSGDVVDQWVPNSNNAQFDNTHAFWICLESEYEDIEGGMRALQHLLRVGALFSVPLDAYDVTPHCEPKQRKAYLVESHSGGIGIARKALERWRDILEAGCQIAKRCTCYRGCPNCIQPPRSRDEINKVEGLELAQLLLDATEDEAEEKFDAGLWRPV